MTDQTSIMHAAKDMMAGIHGGNYPILLDELRPIINALVQYKWSLAQNNSDYSKKTILPNEINHFDATFNLNLLEMDTTENNSNASVFKIPD